jgi:hypothetical protein
MRGQPDQNELRLPMSKLDGAGLLTANAVEELAKGFAVGDFIVYAKRISRGRFIEEANLEIYLKQDIHETYLLWLKVFHGRKPYYSPWIEFFSINDDIIMGEERLSYFGSAFEENLLSLSSKSLEPGGRLFVEYYGDAETAYGLQSGVPPALTRLGFELFKHDFTWFKDWYFPEGFMEGGQKLQGEKPLNSEVRNRQLMNIRNEVNAFLEKIPDLREQNMYLRNAEERAKRILKIIEGSGY